MERRGSPSLRWRAGTMLAVWALAFSLLAVARAAPGPPTASLAVDDATPFVDEPVRFDASRSAGHDEGNGRIVAFRFDPGDGTEGEWKQSPFLDHAYATAGAFVASVMVRDARGRTDDASLEILVRSAPPPTGDAPDLAIVQGSTDPPKPELDDVVKAYASILNRGGTTATSAAVDFFDRRPGGSEIEIGSVGLAAPLPPGNLTVVVSPAFVALEEGAHSLRIVVRDVEPLEQFTDDNEALLPMAVIPRSEPPPGDGPSGGFTIDPIVLGLAAAAGASLVAALVLLTRPRQPGPLDPPSHVPRDRSPPPLWPP